MCMLTTYIWPNVKHLQNLTVCASQTANHANIPRLTFKTGVKNSATPRAVPFIELITFCMLQEISPGNMNRLVLNIFHFEKPLTLHTNSLFKDFTAPSCTTWPKSSDSHFRIPNLAMLQGTPRSNLMTFLFCICIFCIRNICTHENTNKVLFWENNQCKGFPHNIFRLVNYIDKKDSLHCFSAFS